jgi:hypothetical protein
MDAKTLVKRFRENAASSRTERRNDGLKKCSFWWDRDKNDVHYSSPCAHRESPKSLVACSGVSAEDLSRQKPYIDIFIEKEISLLSPQKCKKRTFPVSKRSVSQGKYLTFRSGERDRKCSPENRKDLPTQEENEETRFISNTLKGIGDDLETSLLLFKLQYLKNGIDHGGEEDVFRGNRVETNTTSTSNGLVVEEKGDDCVELKNIISNAQMLSNDPNLQERSLIPSRKLDPQVQANHIVKSGPFVRQNPTPSATMTKIYCQTSRESDKKRKQNETNGSGICSATRRENLFIDTCPQKVFLNDTITVGNLEKKRREKLPNANISLEREMDSTNLADVANSISEKLDLALFGLNRRLRSSIEQKSKNPPRSNFMQRNNCDRWDIKGQDYPKIRFHDMQSSLNNPIGGRVHRGAEVRVSVDIDSYKENRELQQHVTCLSHERRNNQVRHTIDDVLESAHGKIQSYQLLRNGQTNAWAQIK